MFSANSSQVSDDKLFVEDVFSTYLYTGNGGSQTINNGIQLGDGYSAGATGGSGDFSSSYLSIANNSNLNLNGGAYTIEAWLYPRSAPAFATVFGKHSNYTGNPVGGWSLWLIDGRPSFGVDGAYGNVSSATAVPLNTWTHVAISSNGTTATLYVNGVSVGSTSTALTTGTSLPMVIGGNIVNTTWDSAYYYNGLISNLRVVKGVQLYTGNFTVPSSALTAVSGTQLLCLQSPSPFTDSSANAFTLTASSPAPTAQSSGPMPFSPVAGKGGMVWVKARGDLSPLGLVGSHTLYDTNRGTSNALRTNGTFASASISGVTAFNSNGFGLDTNGVNNASGYTYASWTFRKAPKFFDVVTWTGNGASSRFLSHSLGSTPGCIIYKRTDSTSDWFVWHRNLTANDYFLKLNTTDAQDGSFAPFAGGPSATGFPVGHNSTYSTNTNGATYVAYLFAHDTTSDGIIQCGSYTIDGSGNGSPVTLGWEPQWLMVKNASGAGAWIVVDQMRNFNNSTNELLYPNLSNAGASVTASGYYIPNATGFTTGTGWTANQTWIYIAIRRGPMRTPTSGTSVFAPVTVTTNNTITTNFPVDLNIYRVNKDAININQFYDRLRGAYKQLSSTSTNAESTNSASTLFDSNTGSPVTGFAAGVSGVDWAFRRAPSFFDVVCWTTTGSTITVPHNLNAVPELIIFKSRNVARDWWVYSAPTGVSKILLLNDNFATQTYGGYWNDTAPTASVFTSGAAIGSGYPYVAYLFASCPGVSKVGSYTGNGSSQTINCGFAAGARFVMIKRTDSTGDWYVWDTARGIVAANDPHLSLNTTAAEVTTDDSIDPDNSGFIVNQVTATNINVSSATYIYLAVA